jgi:hypothetical protein
MTSCYFFPLTTDAAKEKEDNEKSQGIKTGNIQINKKANTKTSTSDQDGNLSRHTVAGALYTASCSSGKEHLPTTDTSTQRTLYPSIARVL